MNMEIGTEAPQFPKKEYINGIFPAVYEMMKHKVFKVVMFKYNKRKYLNLLNVYNWDDGVYLVLQNDL